jgi:hypothetical protein
MGTIDELNISIEASIEFGVPNSVEIIIGSVVVTQRLRERRPPHCERTKVVMYFARLRVSPSRSMTRSGHSTQNKDSRSCLWTFGTNPLHTVILAVARGQDPLLTPLGTYNGAANWDRVGRRLLPSFSGGQAPAAPHLLGCQGQSSRPGDAYGPAFRNLITASSSSCIKTAFKLATAIVTYETK